MAIIVDTFMAEDLELGTGNTSKPFQGGGTLPGHQISLSTLSLAGAGGSAVTSTPGSLGTLASGGYVSFTVTVSGADPTQNDKALVSFTGALTNTLLVSARVTAANTVTVLVYNLGAAFTFDPGTVSVLVFRHR